ncbi:MAG: glycosyl transferase, partial [Planctomycetia bacterium]|nr:glycosyl transferase [Planctomycetia bacterium]
MPEITPSQPDETPELTVVIASVNGWKVLGPTLDALDALPERDRTEVVVVEALGGETRDRLRDRRRPVVVLESRRLPIPRLRYQG